MGLVNKLESNLDKIGFGLGYVAPMSHANVPGANIIEKVIYEHQQIITGTFLIPTFDSLKWHFDTYGKEPLKGEIMLYIVGEGLTWLGGIGKLSRIGNALKKVSKNAIGGTALGTIVMSLGGGGYVKNSGGGLTASYQDIYGYP